MGEMKYYYPMNLDISKFNCLIVGLGKVGQRKLATLIQFHPKTITILDPIASLPDKFKTYSFINFQQKHFEPEDLQDKELIFACTSNPKLNSFIAHLALKHKLLVNNITEPKEGNFILPAVLKKQDIQISISSSGLSPALVKYLKKEINELIGPEYEVCTKILGTIRPLLLNLKLPVEKRSEMFNNLVSSLIPLLRKKDVGAIKTLLTRALPKELSPYIGEILNECLF
ncbi:MAG: bifunctional precorrin-2 dehydrogenase/sirohydrochlorin ferrochelatase [Desulfonauticus sp.]|nr:bifunctional precorrin-2 dehydrogenase/sirohydrochlorin ferrochelatase [Desulfonauticus sp.]